MLRNLSRYIRECLEHAEACVRKAETAPTDDIRNDFLQLEKSWLKLARSYEFSARLVDFTSEHKRKRDKRQGND